MKGAFPWGLIGWVRAEKHHMYTIQAQPVG
jgi:hypothetical protein